MRKAHHKCYLISLDIVKMLFVNIVSNTRCLCRDRKYQKKCIKLRYFLGPSLSWTESLRTEKMTLEIYQVEGSLNKWHLILDKYKILYTNI